MGEGEGACPGAVRLERGRAYRRRQPERTLLYRAVQENLASLREEAAEVGRGLPRHVDQDFTRYLECGVLAHGSALQVTPRFHALVPDGAWVPLDDGVRFVPLPPPTQQEVEKLVAVVRRRMLRLLERRGALPAEAPEDAKQAYQVHSLQQRLRFPEVDVKPPPRKVPRCAFLEGFSLHANTHLHANDREGLERLCRYGARGALALERFEEAEDGTLLYRMKRPMPDGATHLRFTGLELLRRMAALVPPPRRNLVRFHGVFAPGAKLRPFLVPAAAGPAAEKDTDAAAGEGPQGRGRARTPRLDWAGLLKRTFKQDVLTCARCGGRRRVVSYLTHGPVVRQVLEHLELPADVPPLSPVRSPPSQTSGSRAPLTRPRSPGRAHQAALTRRPDSGEVSTHFSGGRSHSSTSYYATLEDEAGERQELPCDSRLAGSIARGDIGVAYVKCDELVGFRRLRGA